MVKVLQWLLEGNGGVINIRAANHLGWQAIHFAAWAGHLDVLQVIHAYAGHGIMLHANNNRDTCLMLAAKAGHLEVVQWLCCFLRIPLINATNSNGDLPIHLAAKGGHLEVVKWMSKQTDSQLYVTNNKGQTAVDLAQLSDRTDVVAWLNKNMVRDSRGIKRKREEYYHQIISNKK